jgi:hypothetical protein
MDTREDLLEDRAKWIAALWTAVRMRELGDVADQTFANARIREYTAPFAPHSRCVNAFYDLVQADRAEAVRVAGAMNDYLDSKMQARGG